MRKAESRCASRRRPCWQACPSARRAERLSSRGTGPRPHWQCKGVRVLGAVRHDNVEARGGRGRSGAICSKIVASGVGSTWQPWGGERKRGRPQTTTGVTPAVAAVAAGFARVDWRVRTRDGLKRERGAVRVACRWVRRSASHSSVVGTNGADANPLDPFGHQHEVHGAGIYGVRLPACWVARVVSDDGADANAESATCLRSALVRTRGDAHETVGWELHWIAEELAGPRLLVLASQRGAGGHPAFVDSVLATAPRPRFKPDRCGGGPTLRPTGALGGHGGWPNRTCAGACVASRGCSGCSRRVCRDFFARRS